MKLQRATYLIASTLHLDSLLERVVNDIASSLGNVEVAVWLRSDDTDEMILQGVRGCSKFCKGERLRMGRDGMVGHVAATGKMRYAPDVRKDRYYIGCEPETLSEVVIPLKAAGRVIGVISIDHSQLDAYSPDQLKVLQAIAGHTAIAVENARVFQSEREKRERLQRNPLTLAPFRKPCFSSLCRSFPASPLKPPGTPPDRLRATGLTLWI